MKKAISLLLAVMLLVSAIPSAFAISYACGICGSSDGVMSEGCVADDFHCVNCGHCGSCSYEGVCTCDYCNSTDSENGTYVEYDSNDRDGDGELDNLWYTITVPAVLNPRLDQEVAGTVTLTGMWPNIASVKITADEKVTLTNDLNTQNTKDLVVTFEPIVYAGDNTEEKTYTKQVILAKMPADALFGTWSGVFNYNVEYVELPQFSVWHNGTDDIYFFEEGMTWEEWCESKYNASGRNPLCSGILICGENKFGEVSVVCATDWNPIYDSVVDESWNNILPSDVIDPNMYYEISHK